MGTGKYCSLIFMQFIVEYVDSIGEDRTAKVNMRIHASRLLGKEMLHVIVRSFTPMKVRRKRGR